MNDFQRRLAALSDKLKRQEERMQGVAIDGTWVVVKHTGDERHVVGFNLNERDAKILASAQLARVERDEEQELQLIAFQPMQELEARKEGLLLH